MYCSIAGYVSGAIFTNEPVSSVILGLVGCRIFVAVGVCFFNQFEIPMISIDQEFTRACII
jgi:hypothetical protein